jgi:hypothetical protein
MQLYTINSDSRTKTVFAIAALSILTAVALSKLLAGLPFHPALSSAFAIFGVYLWLFDRFIWRWPIVRNLHGIPYLGGEWVGQVVRAPSADGSTRVRVSAFVQQTWTRIQFEVVGEQSRSLIRSFSMDIASLHRKSFIYIYELRPRAEAADRNIRGEGCQELVVINDDTLEGPYFSSKLRKGILTLKRKR